jgi:thioredoxin 1
MVHEVTTETFAREIATQEGITLIDFWAPWCGPCKTAAPIIEELSEEITDVKFVKVNVDDNPSISELFGIRSIPTFVILNDGKPLSAIAGARSKEDYKKWIEEYK